MVMAQSFSPVKMALNKLTPVQTVLAAGSAALVANYVNQQYAISSDLSYMYKVIQIIRAYVRFSCVGGLLWQGWG